MIGRVKSIKNSGYGFIIDDTGEEFFFHHSQFKGDWEELRKISPPNTEVGPTVLFRAIEHKRGPRAEKVELI